MLFQIHNFFSLVASVSAVSRYTLTLTWAEGSPDGFKRNMIFINGQFPGPAIQVQEGDWAEITVVNHLPFNTTIHAHGIDQVGTPWADGVPGLSQRPIQPNSHFTYKWQASTYGSYWYHAHSRAQIDDGSYGPIIVKPKSGSSNPFSKISVKDVKLLEFAEAHVKPLMFSDWHHKTSTEIWDIELASGIEAAVCVDALLVNGKGAVDCWSRDELTKYTPPEIIPVFQASNTSITDKGCLPAEVLVIITNTKVAYPEKIPQSVFNVCTPTKGSQEVVGVPIGDKWMALDLISASGIAPFAVSIDEHPLWVYAVDGHYIEPLKVDAITINNGERYSVFVQLDKPASNYGIRVASQALVQLIDTTAILSYKNTSTGTLSSKPFTNQVGLAMNDGVKFFNEAEMVSFPPQFPQPAPAVDQTFKFGLDLAGSSYRWVLNGTTYDFAIEDSAPPLLYQDPTKITIGRNITFTTRNNTWVDLIFNVLTSGQPPHPIHKHSNKAFIVGQGTGIFKWDTVAEAVKESPQSFNLVTPPYRDGFVTPPSMPDSVWIAVRYQVVNPGAFLIHCHVSSHLEGGMAMIILDGVDAWPQVPAKSKN